MGDVAGVEVTNSNFDETVTIYGVEGSYEGVSVWLQSPVVVSPLQTRSLPLSLLQSGRLPPPRHASHRIALTLHLTDNIVDSRKGATLSTVLVLPVVNSTSEPAPFLSTFLSNTRTPSYAMYTPPTHSNGSFCSSAAFLALHGAGVEASSSSWTESIQARRNEWVVWPTGLTSWGYDWHGPSLKVRRVCSVFQAPS